MKDFFLKVAAALLVAAITAAASALWNMNSRLARIEAVLSVKQQASNHER